MMCYVLMAWRYRDYGDYRDYIVDPFCYGELYFAIYLTGELFSRRFFPRGSRHSKIGYGVEKFFSTSS